MIAMSSSAGRPVWKSTSMSGWAVEHLNAAVGDRVGNENAIAGHGEGGLAERRGSVKGRCRHERLWGVVNQGI